MQKLYVTPFFKAGLPWIDIEGLRKQARLCLGLHTLLVLQMDHEGHMNEAVVECQLETLVEIDRHLNKVSQVIVTLDLPF